ncbi:MAG: hypothetical protein JRI68_14745 [Deltaproteobacteria bacterium]|nr:hypothetical protein [Deltaproteobacteria bacterium]
MSHAITQSPITSTSKSRLTRRSAGRLAGVLGILLAGLIAGCTTDVDDQTLTDDGTVEDDDPSSSGGNGTLQCGAAELYLQVHDTCGVMDATAAPDENGSCFCMLGYAWDGSTCVALADCQCEGADCGSLTETLEECEAAHADCGSGSQGFSCGDPQLYMAVHDICEPMDAVGAPDENGSGCFCALGYAWDGNACVMLGNCQCVGADCDKLSETAEECEAAHTICS